MAQFVAMIPDEEIKQLKKISKNAEKMLGEMTRAGAEVVEKNIIANAPEGIKQEPELMKTLKLSKTYKTPSDDGRIYFRWRSYSCSRKRWVYPKNPTCFGKGTG